jgi:hypothetical protein
MAGQPFVTAYCWVTETPRTQFRIFSDMRKPIRMLYEDWESSDHIAETSAARTLVDLIKRELPEGSTVEDVNAHIRRHYRWGVEVRDWSWSRTNSEGVYVFPWLDVKNVRACWNPRDFLEGGSVQVNYVSLEGAYLRTEIRFVGWKGHDHSQVIQIVATDEPRNGER